MPKAAKAFCVAGAGEATLYKVHQDIEDAVCCFTNHGVEASSMNMAINDKAALLDALAEQWSCAHTAQFFLYYAGHAKRGGQGVTANIASVSGAWVSKQGDG